VIDTNPPLGAESWFDGDPTTGLTVEKGESASVRLDLGAAREVVGLGVRGSGRAKIAIYAEDDKGARRPIGTGRDGAVTLASEHWAQLAPASPTRTSTLVVEWTASSAAQAAISEVALWVAGRARSALAEAAIADRLVTELPENADAATATPWTASVARLTAQGSVSASFALTLNRDPLLGRAFLVYELDKKAHWTGVARSINGHVVRGGYRAEAKGLGGVQVEEINPAWLRQGDNKIAFQPTLVEDGQGYSVRNVRVVSVPFGVEAAPAAGARSPLSDGDPSTGVGGTGAHAASLAVAADRQPAFLSFYLEKPARGTLTVSADGGAGRARRKGQVNVELDGRPAGWQTVPVGGVLPAASELRLRVVGDRESKAQVSEARVRSFPSVASPAGVIVSYPLHGECLDHKTYVRGFVAGASRLQRPQLVVDGQPIAGKLDADGSFEIEVEEPAASRGKPWSIRLDVAAEDASHTRTVPVETCLEPPKQRIIGVSPPVEDVGAPYGAVVSPGKASTLAFAGAQIEIPAGAVDGAVRVTMRALDRGQLAPIKPEMENVSAGGGAMRLGPHGLTFKKPIKVTLPIDSARMPPGMTHGDVVGFFFDEASSKWTELPKVSGRADRVVALTTHFTDFIASTVRTPDHPDMQQFNPNTMKGVKAGEPGAGIAMIQPPEANASGSTRLSYPIETPPPRAGIGPSLALTYDSERTSSNSWLGVGWDLRLSSIDIDTRFGVPKYDTTDVYSLDGAMLVQTATAGRYIRRVESSFDRIERQGTGPTNYSWKVTDKAGTVYTYGTVANSRLANLRPGQSANIFRWYLERVQDVFGNFMTITYAHDTFTTGAAPNVETFDEVYPSVIDYTGGPSLAANYHVEFRLDAVGTRPDTSITGRPGFLVSTRRRLADILVKNGTAVVRQYKFFYEPDLAGTMQKSLLQAVALWSTQDSAATELYRHSFEYFKAPALNAVFSGQQQWGQVVKAATAPATGTVPRTEKPISNANEHTGGKDVTFGVGFPLISATGTYGKTAGSSTPDLAFLGLTGEGLPDQVDTGGTMSLNVLRGVSSNAHFQAASLTGLPGFGSTSRSGWSAGGNISALSGLFGVGARYGRQVAADRGLVSDINGDGFPDVVFSAGGGNLTAYVNDGKRNFTQKQWTGYSLSGSTFSTSSRVAQANTEQGFETDPLVRWVAPFGGTVTVNATTVRNSSTAGDDVRVDLYVATDAVRSVTIPGNDVTSRTLASNVSRAVNAGDRVYIRLAPLGINSLGNDGVDVSATIAYTPPSGSSATDRDPTGVEIFRFDAPTDFITAGQPFIPWRLSGNGDITVGRCFSKNTTPDDVKFSYVIRDKDANIVTRFDKVGAAASTGSICFDNAVLPPLASDQFSSTITGVSADQSVSIEVTSDTPVDMERVDVGNNMRYTRYCRVARNGSQVCGAPTRSGAGYTIPGDPYPSFPIDAQDIVPGLDAPGPMPIYRQTYVWQVFNNGTTTTPQPMRKVAAPSASVTFGGSVTTSAALTDDVFVLIQGVNKLHKKVRIPAGTASGVTTAVTTGAIAVTSGESVFFTIYSPKVIGGSVTWSPTMNGAAVAANSINKAILDPTYDNNPRRFITTHDPMSSGFHNWSYGDWNDSIAFNDSLIARTGNLPQNNDAVSAAIPVEITDTPSEWRGRGGTRIGQGRATAGISLVPGQVNSILAMTSTGSGISALRIADTWNVDVTASVSGVSAGGNGGDATTQVDFFDVNGDRFPDSVTRSGVAYNNGTGSFATRQTIDAGFGDLRRTFNASLQAGVSVSGSDRQIINESDAQGRTRRLSSTTSLSGSVDYGVSSTRIDFADVNGDGLEDHIMQDNARDLRVKLNLGYGFSNEITWAVPANWSQARTSVAIANISATDVGRVLNLIPGDPASTNVVRLQDTGTISASIGANLGVIGGGGGPTWSVTRKWVDLIDINGDGLPDQVLKVPGQANLRVRLNKGDRFDAEQTWTLPDWSVSPGNDFSFLTPDGLEFSTMEGWGKNLNFKICFFVCFGMSGFSSDAKGGPTSSFQDVNGDGRPDQVLKVPGDAKVYAKLSNIYTANLLSAVNRPLGSRFTISYAPVGNHVDLQATPKMNMPSNKWAMTSVVMNSGYLQSWNETTTDTFNYANAAGYGSGYFDPVEREDLGFGIVKTIYPSEDLGGTSIISEYRNQDYFTRGLEVRRTWYQNHTNGIRLRTINTDYNDPSGVSINEVPPRTGRFFPAPTQTRTELWETGGNANLHVVSRTFNTNGDLTDVVDSGDTNFTGFNDDFNYHIDYQSPGTNITVPSTITVRTGATPNAGTLLAKRTVTSFTAQGKPNGVTDVIVNGKSPDGTARTEAAPTNATWTFTYDTFGNVQRATSPNGTTDGDGNARTLEYTYDTTTRTYPVTTAQIDSDPIFQYRATANYDLRFGLPTRIIDVAGARQEIDYDAYGRISKVFAPTDFDANGNRINTNAPTIDVAYSQVAHTAGAAEPLPGWAMATHRSNAPPEGTLPTAALTTRSLRTVNFVDGRNRSIQVKRDITRDDGTGATTAGMSVSGKTTFDARGRVYRQGQPTFAAGTATPTTFVAVTQTNPTEFAYDVLGRLRQESHQDGGVTSRTTISYQKAVSPKDGREWVVRMVADPLYGQNFNFHYRAEYRTGRDELRLVDEPNSIGGTRKNLYTSYVNDPLGRVVSVTDAKNNVTTAEYDTVGNLIAVTSPDAGRREWRYCPGGYVCGEQSASMRAAGSNVRIQYAYDRDLLIGITYPNPTASPGVTFAYGAANETGAANGFKASRIRQRTDEAGRVDYAYDAFGNIASETAVLKNQMAAGTNYQSYQTQYRWDSFGRLIDVTIPGTTSVNTPTETIRYGYDAGGAVTSAWGRAGTTDHPYVRHVGYNEFGERVRITYGNQAFSKYGYAADTRRLNLAETTIQPTGQAAQTAQRLTYRYDLLGNITFREQALAVQTGVVPGGGFISTTYTYDPLSQLTHADLQSIGASDFSTGSVDVSYDEIGNIKRKASSDSASGGVGQNNYTFTPAYAGTAFNASPHAPSSISEQRSNGTSTRTIAYDRNGNVTSSLYGTTGRFITWTDNDRIRSMCNGTASACAPMTQSLYAADGTRTHNKVTQGTTSTETLYVNQHLTVRNGTLPTKHVYLGGQRVASKVESNATTNNTYWYHSDHLQTTQYVTTTGQFLVQHLEHYPSGEIWREETDTARLRTEIGHATTFSGKELDASGYYYFGARYYDPQVQMWLSPDPILASYMKGAPAGGVFQPRNLGLYTYTWNNPVVLMDPDGLSPNDPWYVRAGKGVLGVAHGVVLGFTPGGGLIRPDVPRDSDFLYGMALGQAGASATQLAGGIGVGGGGGALEVVTLGGATPIAVPAMAAGAYLVTNGAAAAAASTQTMVMAVKAAERESGGGGSTVQSNKERGDAFRDEVAERFRQEGYDVKTEVTKETPLGPRRIDVEVSKNGGPPSGIETKVGGSRYVPKQRAKDAFLGREGYPVTVVRDK
jgi:RHS repeat-associated protein